MLDDDKGKKIVPEGKSKFLHLNLMSERSVSSVEGAQSFVSIFAFFSGRYYVSWISEKQKRLLNTTQILCVLVASILLVACSDFDVSAKRTVEQNEVVVGDFGGMRVEIPSYYVRLVEYDGDPSFGQIRQGPSPGRTFESRIRSFGLSARYPDMSGLVDDKTREEKRLQPLSEDSWLNVGIISGEFYSGDDFLQKLTRNLRGDTFDRGEGEFKGHWNYLYRRQSSRKFGLDVFLLTGTDPRTGKPASQSEDTYDIYIHRDSANRVDTFIQCNRTYVPGGIAVCHMEFGLAPQAHVEVDVGFRSGLLSEWRGIRQSVQHLLLSFEAGKQ